MNVKLTQKESAEFQLYNAGEISGLKHNKGKKIKIFVSCADRKLIKDLYFRIKPYLIDDTSHI